MLAEAREKERFESEGAEIQSENIFFFPTHDFITLLMLFTIKRSSREVERFSSCSSYSHSSPSISLLNV